MSVFVNAANRILSTHPSSLGPANPDERDSLFSALLPHDPQQSNPTADEVPLRAAFNVLWAQFQGDQQQSAVCARILAFHFLMEHTRGAIVEAWLRPCLDDPGAVVLDEIVVGAVAVARLEDTGSFARHDFLQAIRTLFIERSQIGLAALAAAPQTLETERAVANHSFAEQFLACEASQGGSSIREPLAASNVCERLSRPLCALVGKVAFRLLVLRALSLSQREHQVLHEVWVTPDGALESSGKQPADAEAALIRYLLEVPASLIGHAMTQTLLCTAWPELDLRRP